MNGFAKVYMNQIPNDLFEDIIMVIKTVLGMNPYGAFQFSLLQKNFHLFLELEDQMKSVCKHCLYEMASFCEHGGISC